MDKDNFDLNNDNLDNELNNEQNAQLNDNLDDIPKEDDGSMFDEVEQSAFSENSEIEQSDYEIQETEQSDNDFASLDSIEQNEEFQEFNETESQDSKESDLEKNDFQKEDFEATNLEETTSQEMSFEGAQESDFQDTSYEETDFEKNDYKQTSPQEMITVRPVKFEEFELTEPNRAIKKNLDIMQDISMHISVELGRTKSTIREVMEMQEGTVVELDKIAGEQVEVFVNNKLVAKGEVIVIEDKFGVRITSTNLPKVVR